MHVLYIVYVTDVLYFLITYTISIETVTVKEREKVSSTSDNEVIELQSNPLYTVHTHKPTAAAYQSIHETPITMEKNPVYQVTKSLGETEPSVEERGNTADTDLTDYYENTGLGPAQQQDYDYVQV